MMEGMNQVGQEEYIWAMRISAFRESDSELWKERRSSATVYDVSSKIDHRKTKSRLDTTTDARQTKVMASLIPDETIYNVDDYSQRKCEACFLFGDVSGFTELAEKYTKTGVSGPSRMTQVLNKYLGSMVQEVLSHNGDVYKFSGDAFLAAFKSSETETIRDSVHEALDCALIIQKSYGAYMTDVGVVIRVKLAVSAGPVVFALIGDQHNSHYVVVGQPIWDVKAAESISSAGDIVVAPAAWHYVNSNEYVIQDMSDGVHIKLIGIGPNWRSVQRNVRQQKAKDDSSDDDDDSEDDDSSESEISIPREEEFSLRPVLNYANRLRLKEKLRKFIIAPVMKSIDRDEPFEYLTEMRQTVVVFINVISNNLENMQTVVLAHETYKIVCRVVDKMRGCVNKVSLFDKDLMFLVIFGLRGLKHELECQIALRCASECHDAINRLPGVSSTSIGVTTGKTYCGVFGHTLRREYTVISLVVNKAARLMVAYKNKVTCDRETFIHSKLESRNFILQEQKPLKGISHPGPIYEFKEVEEQFSSIQKINSAPLLGRDSKVKSYTQLLEKILTTSQPKEQQYKMLWIEGDARQGKTRLLDEFVYVTPDEIPVNRLLLTRKDYDLPYQAIKLLVFPPLTLHAHSSVTEKENVILKKLRKIQVPELLCSLNDVLGVNFKVSELYLSLSEPARLEAKKKVLKQLCYAVLPITWVMAIDNAEHIDDASWDLFEIFFDLKTIFIVALAAKEKIRHSSNAMSLINDARVKRDNLTPIDRYYLGALACQFLDVYAIPAELEIAIQAKSNGNPGWIESFLISLIQDDSLYIVKASLNQINEFGLVCPPLYLMKRLSPDEKLKWQHLMEERRPSMDSILENNHWKKYIDTCRDSYLNVTVREHMESIDRGSKVPVGVVPPDFKIGDEDAEMSMDVVILKTFDSLSSFEQLLIKCSSTLGIQFLRDMLLYVMSAESPRQAALAVKKLFEIKVLTCAKGDFLEGGTLVFRERLKNPSEDDKLKCECRGVKIDESCADLPKYASCGYMQFRSTLFRNITYNLLTDNQKKEFHLRAIRYLEKETRRCKACGYGFFERILGEKYDKDFMKAKEGKKRVAAETISWDDTSMSRRTSVYSAGQHSLGKKRNEENKSIFSTPSTLYVESKSIRNFKPVLGITLINKLKNSFSLTRAFSSEDFTDCQCNLILSTTYAQLIDHCTGAVELNKLLEAMMEFAYICIITCNITLAMKVLDDALGVLKQKSKEKIENRWKLSLIRGKIFTLIGYSRLELGQFNEALKSLHRSLAEYGITFPKGLSKKMATCAYEFKQLFGFYIFPKTLSKKLDHWENVFSNNLSECLSHLCNLHMALNQWEQAELAATWSLSRALAAFSDFQVLCTAFANMLFVAEHYRRWNLCVALEVHALRLCHLKQARMESEELKSVANLYGIIFSSRVFRANVDKAIQIGYIVLRLSSTIHAPKIILPLLPHLMYCLLAGNHTSNAISILQELELFAEEDSDNSGKVWYYALAICFHLETGYTLIPYQVCEHFYQVEGDSWITIRDPDARKRYFTVMWLWCVRNEKWEAASLWCIKTDDFRVVKENDTLANKITSLYLLEGLILYFVFKMDKRNVQAVMNAENEINHLFGAIKRAGQFTKIILPRLYHLKAYYRFVKHNDSKVTSLLNKAKKYATKYGNALELSWIEHSTKAWNKTLHSIAIDFWKEHSDPDNLLDVQELEVNIDKLGFYTLPTPLYISC